MDTAFFIASKVIWAFISPDSLIVLLGAGAWFAMLIGWQKLSRSLLASCTFLLVTIAALPVGEWLIAPLENRFSANAALPANPDGVIVLGGALDPLKSELWGQAEVQAFGERIYSLLYMSQLYPSAQIIYSGGNGSVLEQDYNEADYARFLFDQLGLTDRAILYESESRNTAENATNSKTLVNPQPDQDWILVTSAFHMPRSVGVFCQQEWPVYAYPVDHYSQRGNLLRLNFNFAENLSVLRTAVREWVGLVAYRFSGRSDRFLAGEQNQCLNDSVTPASN